MPKKTLIPLIIAAGVVVLAGAVYSLVARKTVENSTEKAIESATGGDADVDISSDTYKVNTNGGSFQAGEDVSLPSGFPDDIYVISGDIKAAYTTTQNQGYNITIEATKSPADANTTYDREMRSDGWSITSTATYGGTYSITGQKGDRYLNVGITESEGKTAVILTTYTQSS